MTEYKHRLSRLLPDWYRRAFSVDEHDLRADSGWHWLSHDRTELSGGWDSSACHEVVAGCGQARGLRVEGQGA